MFLCWVQKDFLKAETWKAFTPVNEAEHAQAARAADSAPMQCPGDAQRHGLRDS